MIPTAFDKENGVLDTPKGMTPSDCAPLSVWRGSLESGTPVVISCWKMTAAELAEIQKTGRVWLMIRGETMPPAHLAGVSPWEEVPT